MLTQEQFEQERIIRCLDEMYQASQPPITWEEVKTRENGLNEHYLSNEEYRYILNKYNDLYRLEDNFKRDCDILIRDAVEGYSVDKYIEATEDSPGYRSYEKKLPLKDQIGEEMANKFIEFIESRRDFYRFNRLWEQFNFTVMNYSPCSNKETVIKTWKEMGKDITIIDRNMDYNYERYYLGTSEEEIQEIIEEEKYYKENNSDE